MEFLDGRWQCPSDESPFFIDWDLQPPDRPEPHFNAVSRSSDVSKADPEVSENSKVTKRSRGRPRITTDPAAHIQRRRKQVRLAQRTYRDRQGDAFVTLKKDSKELDLLTRKVDGLFDELLKLGSGIGLSRSQPTFAERLHSTADDFSRLAVRSAEIQQSIVTGSGRQKATDGGEKGRQNVNEAAEGTTWRTDSQYPGRERGTDMSSVSLDQYLLVGGGQESNRQGMQKTNLWGAGHNQPPNRSIADEQARKSSQSWFDPFGVMWLPKSTVPEMVRGAVADSTRFIFSRSGDSHAINVALFANQLQLRALQRGYRIITGAGTRRSLLDQTFGHCIPQKSRSHIVHRVEYLMQCLSETCDEAMQSAKRPQQVWLEDAMEATDDIAIDPWTRMDPSGAVVRYIGAADVSEYVLSERFDLDSVSDMADDDWRNPQSSSPDLNLPRGSPQVQELVEALSLVSIVLNNGPAFRKSDVERLLRTSSVS